MISQVVTDVHLLHLAIFVLSLNEAILEEVVKVLLEWGKKKSQKLYDITYDQEHSHSENNIVFAQGFEEAKKKT